MRFKLLRLFVTLVKQRFREMCTETSSTSHSRRKSDYNKGHPYRNPRPVSPRDKEYKEFPHRDYDNKSRLLGCFNQDDRRRWEITMSAEGERSVRTASTEREAKYSLLQGNRVEVSSSSSSDSEAENTPATSYELQRFPTAEERALSLISEASVESTERKVTLAAEAFEARINKGLYRFIHRYGRGVGDLSAVESSLREKYAADDLERLRDGEPLPVAKSLPETLASPSPATDADKQDPTEVAKSTQQRLEAFLQEECEFEAAFNVVHMGFPVLSV
jgi:hypothetical protein